MTKAATIRPREEPFSASIAATVLLALTAVRLVLLANETYPLYGDEAQYWVWGQALDWGYFSKPPMVAWLIRLTTEIFGNREFGVRVLSPVFHGATGVVLYHAARTLFDSRVAFWSAVTYALLPAVTVSSLLMTTDVPLLFFWTVGLLCFIRAIETDSWTAWTGLGVALGFGLLSKYSMALFLAGAVVYLGTMRRDILLSRRFWTALAVAGLIYAPNLIWNLHHSLASFKHTASNAGTLGPVLHPKNVFNFLASQLAVFGPTLFITLLAGLGLRIWRRRFDRSEWLLVCFVLPPLVMALSVALISRANANWAAASYISGTILVVAWLSKLGARRLLLSGTIAVHALAGVVAYAYHDLAATVGITLTAKTDPFVRLMRGKRLGQAVAQMIREHGTTVLMTDERMMFAELAFYVRPRPVQVEFNAKDHPTDQFEMTTSVKDYADTDILYVSKDEDAFALSHFETKERVGTITIPLYPDRILRFAVFRVRGYRG